MDCCPTDEKASGAGEAPVGEYKTLDSGLRVYVTGREAKRVILAAPDIFGVDIAASTSFLDKLAMEAEAVVVLVDHFHGKPWPLADFPPADRSKLMTWIESESGPEKIKGEIDQALAFVKQVYPSLALGLLGFCWGGKVVFTFGSKLESVRACASAHPSFLTRELVAECLAQPELALCLLPSKDEDEALFEELRGMLEQADKKHVFKRYAECSHGWCQARASPGEAAWEEGVADARGVLASFFKSSLN